MRITEQSNPLTAKLDQASPCEIIDLIGRADKQIFGSEWGSGLFDQQFIERFEQLKQIVHDVLAHPKGRLIMTGAGTSGRLAVQCAATSNNDRIIGLMAGGLDAFFRAKERVEDLPEAGVTALHEVTGDGPYVLLGITCGLSAAWVAGQVHSALADKRARAVAVLGFNPLDAAVKRPLPGLNCTIHQLFAELSQHPKGYLLNPIIGPEPVTGSTRMKGGTATKIILDCLQLEAPISDILPYFQDLQNDLYHLAQTRLDASIKQAGQALNKGGALVYRASGRAALMAMLDASECPPTFGARYDQVKAYVDKDFQLLLPDFDMTEHQMSRLDPGDHDALFSIGGEDANLASEWVIRSTPPPDLKNSMQDLALKWCLNLISTGAFLLNGKIWGNRMIDLKISNIKLWERAIGIVANIGETSQKEADRLLRETISGVEGLSEDVEALIPKAVRTEKVVGTAILAALKKISPTRARDILKETPKLKDAIKSNRVQF